MNDPRTPGGLTRRGLLGAAGLTIAAAPAMAQRVPPELPNRAIGRPDPRLSNPQPEPADRQLGFAVVGLGKLALGEVLDAFTASRRARLAALVSGNAEKARAVAARYGVPADAIYSYDSFDRIAQDPRVDVVYIILPNGLHAEWTVRAFKAGKHVLCEKPMATTAADCERMMQAAEAAGRQLMIAYRAQFEPHSLAAMRMLRKRELGDVRLVVTDNGRPADPSDPADVWRLDAELAGSGSLFDIGIYGVNGARYLLNEEPEEVRAWIYTPPGDPRFREVEDVVSWQMRMPGGALVNGSTSYSYAGTSHMQVIGTEGRLVMDPATNYRGHRVVVHGRGGERMVQERQVDQFAREMDYFVGVIRDRLPNVASGAEGLQDVRIMRAILDSAREGRAVRTDFGYRRVADPAEAVSEKLPGVA